MAKQEQQETNQTVQGIQIKHPKTGQMVMRADYIRDQIFGEGRTRGAVARELSKQSEAAGGKPIQYQTCLLYTSPSPRD